MAFRLNVLFPDEVRVRLERESRERRWSTAEFVRWCVEQQLGPVGVLSRGQHPSAVGVSVNVVESPVLRAVGSFDPDSEEGY